MKRSVLLLVALVLGMIALAAHGATTQLIPWSENLNFHWGLFLGSPPSDAGPNDVAGIYVQHKWAASNPVQVGSQTASGWTVRASVIVVSNQMNPKLSWARHDRVTDSALQHEWYHFTLHEVYRRKLEAELQSVQVTHSSQAAVGQMLMDEIRDTADSLTTQANAMQKVYDNQTNHGQDTSAQRSWEAQIDAWLASPSQAPDNASAWEAMHALGP